MTTGPPRARRAPHHIDALERFGKVLLFCWFCWVGETYKEPLAPSGREGTVTICHLAKAQQLSREEQAQAWANSVCMGTLQGKPMAWLLPNTEDRQTDRRLLHEKAKLSLWSPGALLFVGNQRHEPSPRHRAVPNKQRPNIGRHQRAWLSLGTKGRKLGINTGRSIVHCKADRRETILQQWCLSMLVLSAQQEDKETLGLFAARMKRWNGAGAGGGQPSLGKNVYYRASASSSRQQSSKPGKTQLQVLTFQLEAGLVRAVPPRLLFQLVRHGKKANPWHKSLPTTASKEDGSLNHTKPIGKKTNTSGHGGGRIRLQKSGEGRAQLPRMTSAGLGGSCPGTEGGPADSIQLRNAVPSALCRSAAVTQPSAWPQPDRYLTSRPMDPPVPGPKAAALTGQERVLPSSTSLVSTWSPPTSPSFTAANLHATFPAAVQRLFPQSALYLCIASDSSTQDKQEQQPIVLAASSLCNDWHPYLGFLEWREEEKIQIIPISRQLSLLQTALDEERTSCTAC